MKILVASGSFKDVYNSAKICGIIRNILCEKKDVDIAPMCDGGEYTFETMQCYNKYHIENVSDILNPYFKNVNIQYLSVGDTAYIISSEIIRLHSHEEEYKNPLLLTDYGLGQAVKDAIDKDFKKIFVCLGGTSTTSVGMGFAQALGAEFYDRDDKLITEPIRGIDLICIKKIIANKEKYKDIELKILADGDIKFNEMDSVTKMKIGLNHKNEKIKILKKINTGVQNIVDLSGIPVDTGYTGVAGGLPIGIGLIFDYKIEKGSEYFAKLFDIESKIKTSDLIITGEGKFDNSECGKTPFSILEIAKKYNKKVIYACGQVDKSGFNYSNESIWKNNEKLKSYGIDILISCEDYYDKFPLSENYSENIETFKKRTPDILKEKFRKVGL